jgi:transcriptional regulator with XRE-family HTH domain
MPDDLAQEPQSGLGQAVQALRKEAGIDQLALAERSRLPEPLIAEIESGEADPVWGDVRRVAMALGVSLEQLSELAERFEGD